jgi:hypothetical protein
LEAPAEKAEKHTVCFNIAIADLLTVMSAIDMEEAGYHPSDEFKD